MLSHIALLGKVNSKVNLCVVPLSGKMVSECMQSNIRFVASSRLEEDLIVSASLSLDLEGKICCKFVIALSASEMESTVEDGALTFLENEGLHCCSTDGRS